MKWGEADSQYLSKTDLEMPGGGYRAVHVQISHISEEAMPEREDGTPGKQKFVVYFMGKTKGMAMGPEACSEMSDALGQPPGGDIKSINDFFAGRHCEAWVNESIKFAGKRVGGLRVRAPSPADAGSQEPPPPTDVDAPPPDDGEIPF